MDDWVTWEDLCRAYARGLVLSDRVRAIAWGSNVVTLELLELADADGDLERLSTGDSDALVAEARWACMWFRVLLGEFCRCRLRARVDVLEMLDVSVLPEGWRDIGCDDRLNF